MSDAAVCVRLPIRWLGRLSPVDFKHCGLFDPVVGHQLPIMVGPWHLYVNMVVKFIKVLDGHNELVTDIFLIGLRIFPKIWF